MFTARYALGPYIAQLRLVLKVLSDEVFLTEIFNFFSNNYHGTAFRDPIQSAPLLWPVVSGLFACSIFVSCNNL